MERSSRRKKRSASTSPVPSDATKKPKQPVIIAVSKDPPDDPTQAFVPLDRDIMYHYLDLPPADADHVPPPEPLKQSERLELQAILEFADQGEWHSDWSGNLTFMDKLISNPTKRKKSSSFQQSLLQWATNVQQPRYLYNLLRMIYHLPNTPQAAKTILASASATDVTSLEQAMRRVSYDPVVLRQDGWTTMRSEDHPSATGGPYYIGAKIRWQDSDAVVIAYVHDADIGDLWKAYWIHEQQCFDLEYEEVLEAKRKWERRNQQQQNQQQQNQQQQSRKSSRFAGSHDFSVPGIEHGIVLAASFAKGARPGVYWPARVVHASEHSALAVATTSKRSSAKQKVDLMFLAPYWNSDARQKSNSLSEAGSSFSAGPLFHLENVDATDEMIKEYTFGNSEADGQQLDLDELRMSFRFTGLPKPAFQRFLDSHRLALALKTYAQHHLQAEDFANAATAGLFETHIMSVQAPLFPSVVLHLPFDFILEQLRNDKEPSRKSGTMQDKEPALQLSGIVESMKRPNCWGLSGGVVNGVVRSPMASTPIKAVPLMDAGKAEDDEKKTSVNGEVNALFESMTDDLALLQKTLSRPSTDLACLRKNIGQIIASLVNASSAKEDSQRDAAARRQRLIQSWVIMKRTGADILSVNSNKCKVVLREWNVASERIYRYVVAQTTNELEGNGKSLVLSDYRCNGHRTSGGCFERAVRLPAAMKGAKLAGAGKSPSIGLVTEVGSKEMERAEREIIPRAHTKSYVERMKTRCAAAKANEESVMLTDDSQGNGGQDTRGSKGTWDAAVAAVAAAVTGVDKIVHGECMNAFCVTRPPGHHAGRTLHCMKAVSNGFCILNAVACAALYAVTPVSDGGHGLSRVCVLDFDVHHGNGTQDILCSTYDSRFLYISIHAGGAHVNGVPMEDDPNHELHDLATKSGGIYPGRCGDTSPHEGVLNIPLGSKVTSPEVGLALVSKVTPRVNAFLPDLIILSAGFDAHKCDPMGLGALAASDFGHITEVACQLAFKCCSGRVLSVMEGGYGVPCCRAQRDEPPTAVAADEKDAVSTEATSTVSSASVIDAPTNGGAKVDTAVAPRMQPSKLVDLGDDLPSDMDDQVPLMLQRRLEKCHAEGFIECVCEHVRSLARCNKID